MRHARWLVAALVFVCAVLPRAPGVDRVVSPDEKRWITHSANFYRGITHGELGATYQIGHPGVTVMWVGTLAFVWRYPSYPWEVPGQIPWVQGKEVATFLWAQGREPVDLLASAHLLMGIAVSLVFAVSALWAVRLFGLTTTCLGLLLLAADPFHSALSRLLHLDALTSAFVLLSLLALLCYLYRGGRRGDLVVSGIAAGLAALTKSPALFLVPFTGLILLLEATRARSVTHRETAPWRPVVGTFALWAGSAFAVFVALWPAMWVDPILTAGRVVYTAVGYAGANHEDPLFFRGRIFDGNPGWEFYPVTYLWRTTPSALIGLILAALARLVPRPDWLPPPHRRPLAVLLVFAALFAAFMSVSAKKHDRYILAVYPPLLLVAGSGWAAATRWLRQRSSPLARPAAAGLVAAALGSQAWLAARTYPYYLSYYNPLLGGTAAAPAVMQIGWGEGLDQMAGYLNSRTDVPSPRVMVGVWGGTFSYYFKGRIIDTKFGASPGTLDSWRNADFAVVYINQWQRRQVPDELMTHLARHEPAFVLRLNGLVYGYVYDIRDMPPPDYLRRAASEHATSLRDES